MSDDFFIGWAETSRPTRRFLLGAAGGLILAGAGAASVLSASQDNPGRGLWDQGDVRDWTGLLVRAPYPMLLMREASGDVRTAFLATNGKLGVQPRLPGTLNGEVTVRASAIERGRNLMLAVSDDTGWIRPAIAAAASPPVAKEVGCTVLIGEILDAKCWFGAMKPGFGKTHKSCAALCARGRLPLAFCAPGGALCAGEEPALLLLDETGAPHGREIIPLVADPVRASGTLWRLGDLMTLRAARKDIVRVA